MLRQMLMTIGILALPALAPAAPETQLSKQVAAGNKAVVAKNMILTSDEAKTFWPLYDDYQIQLNKLADETDAVIVKFSVNYNDLTDKLAADLMDAAMKLEKKRVDLKMQWMNRMGRQLPAKVVARFYQIQSKLEAADRAQVMQQIPLIKTE